MYILIPIIPLVLALFPSSKLKNLLVGLNYVNLVNFLVLHGP